MEKILVLDFGGQYNQLIARRVRDHGVFAEILPYTTSLDTIRQGNYKGIIFPGGPNSVYDPASPHYTPEVLELGVPVETVPAAELRHTLLPTVDSHTALVALISSRELTEKTCAALQLAAIRGAGTVACTVESLAGQLSGARQVFLFPDSLPLLAPVCQCATLSMLLLRLCTAREQAGRPVEQPPVLPRYFAG